MKKVLSITAAVVILGSASAVSATSYTHTVELDTWLAEGTIAGLLAGIIGQPETSKSYEHMTPSDFEVPYDIVNSAQLTITAYLVDGTFVPDTGTLWPFDGTTLPDDVVKIEGTVVGTLYPGGDMNWSWSGWTWEYGTPSETPFDISSTFSNWPNGESLGVSISAIGGLGDGALYLDKSVFKLDYTNATAPVPEPTTMLLFGTGLAGLAAVGRRRRQN